MLKLLIFTLSTAGLSFAVTRTYLFKGMREYISDKAQIKNTKVWLLLESLVTCSFCVGFWAGIMMYFLIYIISAEALYFPFMGAMVSLLIVELSKKI